MNDIRFALRLLGKSPGFTIVAILTLALGIGANSGIFTIVDAVMLSPLPYPEPDRLISMWETTSRQRPSQSTSSGSSVGGVVTPSRTTVSPANLVDYQKGSHAFTAMAGIDRAGMNLTGIGTPERLFGERVTANYFTVLGVQPAQGRAFTAEEDRPGNDRIVVITDELWRRRFGADSSLLGSAIQLEGENRRVIGIMPPGFQPPSQFGLTDRLSFLVPAAYPPELLAQHGDHEINVIARLKPGATIEQARAEMDSVSAALEKEFPNTNRGIRTGMAPLSDDLARNVRTSILVLLGAVGLILLIACVNLANLLLARAVGRRREITIRFALGASRARVIGELLTQSAVLSAFGCGAGLAVGAWTKQMLVKFAPAGIPRLDSAGFDPRVFLFTAGLSFATGMLFGLFPAWQVSKARPAESLKSSERGAVDRAVMRWRDVLMASEIAIAMVLLVGAGLLLRSFIRLSGIELGFETEHVVAMNISLPEARYASADKRYAFFHDLADRVAALPGVSAVGFGNRMPMRGGWSGSFQLDSLPGQDKDADLQAVSAGYFPTLGIPLLRGRGFSSADGAGAARVAIVNTAFARAFLNGQDPVGHQLRRNKSTPWVTIIGVVGDIRRDGKAANIEPEVYFPAAQTDLYPVRIADLAFRAAGNPKALVTAVQQQVWAIDKDQPVTNVKTLDEVISQAAARQRFQMLLLMLFAAIALALALVGVYGVISYAVSQRTSEIGLRIALGARPGDILRMVLRRSMLVAGAGIVAGVTGALGLSRYLASLLFEITPGDPLTYGALTILMASIAAAACYVPARRAAKVDPMVALRYE
jgi:predicted permease